MNGEDYTQMEPERRLMSYWNDCPATKPPARSLEEFLATIDTGIAVAPNDPVVDAARHVLDRLVGKYPSYSRQLLANVSVLAHQLLQAQGVTISVLQFMREVDRATPVAAVRYEDACATFVALLTVHHKL